MRDCRPLALNAARCRLGLLSLLLPALLLGCGGSDQPVEPQAELPEPAPAVTPCSPKPLSAASIAERYHDGIVVIEANQASGTGFVIHQLEGSTLLVTNSHVLEGASQVSIRWPDGRLDQASVVLDGGRAGSSMVNDLALLEVKGEQGVVLPLSPDPPRAGAEVIAIGTPSGLDFSISKGVISGIRDNGQLIQTDTAINSGSSGGPLIGLDGCVVGVNTFSLADSVGLNFALSAALVRRFAEDFLPSATGRSSNALEQRGFEGSRRATSKSQVNELIAPASARELRALLDQWFSLKSDVLAGRLPAQNLAEVAIQPLVQLTAAARSRDARAAQSRELKVAIISFELLPQQQPGSVIARVRLQVEEQILDAEGVVLALDGPRQQEGLYSFLWDHSGWRLSDIRPAL